MSSKWHKLDMAVGMTGWLRSVTSSTALALALARTGPIALALALAPSSSPSPSLKMMVRTFGPAYSNSNRVNIRALSLVLYPNRAVFT